MREYLIMKTMLRFDVSVEEARIIIGSLDKKGKLEDYYNMIGSFSILSDIKTFYKLNY